MFNMSSLARLPILPNTFFSQAIFIEHLLSAGNIDRTQILVPASRLIIIQRVRGASKQTTANH